MSQRFVDDGTRGSAPPRDSGVLASGVVIEGSIRGRADLRIDGSMRGAIELDGALVVGPDAQLAGPVSGLRVDVSGELVGDIRAGHVALRSGACVSGDVHAGSITIDDGATLEGLIDMELDASDAAGEGAR